MCFDEIKLFQLNGGGGLLCFVPRASSKTQIAVGSGKVGAIRRDMSSSLSLSVPFLPALFKVSESDVAPISLEKGGEKINTAISAF